MKRVIAAFAALVLCITLLPPVSAAGGRDLDGQTRLAAGLRELGLFLGRENEDHTVDFALEDPLSRTEAVVMLLRALGHDAEARDHTPTHPFTDVPSWADGYISYAYAAGLAAGISETEFDALTAASAGAYATLLLRALGYADGEGGDFTWDNPWALAEESGIVPAGVDRQSFRRGDAVEMTCAALFADKKGGGSTLADSLIAGGVFTAEQFRSAFPVNPFAPADPGETGAPAEPEDPGLPAEDRALYEAELEKLKRDGLWCKFDYTETDLCTVVNASYSGGSRGTFYSLYLVYKPGSPMGVKTVELPLPLRSNSGANARADNTAISDDGKRLTYSFHFDETLINHFTDEVMQEAGTYQYTTDLTTGETALKHIP